MWSDWPCKKTSAVGDACGYLSYIESKFPLSRGKVGGSSYLINTSHIWNPPRLQCYYGFRFQSQRFIICIEMNKYVTHLSIIIWPLSRIYCTWVNNRLLSLFVEVNFVNAMERNPSTGKSKQLDVYTTSITGWLYRYTRNANTVNSL